MRPISRRAFLALAAGLGAGVSPGAPARAGAGRVAAVRPPLDLVLEDGRVLRPVGFAPTPGAVEVLRDRLTGRPVRFRAIGRDRHGRHLAWIGPDDAPDWQPALLRAGAVWAWPFAVPAADWPALAAAEAAARRNGLGLWRAGAPPLVVPARAAEAAIGTPALVAGTIQRVDRRGGWVHLDFGANWRRDFTASYRERTRDPFAPPGGAAEDFAGRPAEVRGVPIWRFGPAIELRVAGQLRAGG